MNIVMVDSQHLAGDADFPDINLDKYGWQQYLSLHGPEVEERCWRADIIISANTPITSQVIDKAFKLKLIIAAGDNSQHIDHQAAQQRNIAILNVAGLNGDTPQNTQQICQRVVEHINQWIANSDKAK